MLATRKLFVSDASYTTNTHVKSAASVIAPETTGPTMAPRPRPPFNSPVTIP